jgi:hypothetical protein
MSSPSRHHSRPVTLAAGLLAGLILSACTATPDPVPTPTQTPSQTDLSPNDPDVEALDGHVRQLRETIAALRTALEAAATGDGTGLITASALLAADSDDPTVARDGASDPAALAPLLPGPDVSRLETVAYGDLLTRTLSAARGAGSAGERVARFLADPLAGDLGSWQRSPADLLDLIAQAADASDLDSAAPPILALDGDAPRALAWVLYGIGHPADASEAAGRALAHLTVIETALADIA